MKQTIQNTRHRLATLLLLVVAMFISQAANADVKPSGDGTADSPYRISNAADLYWFANKVNSGYTDINAVLTADIVVNGDVLDADGTLNGAGFNAWTPIGDINNEYAGTFDGQGHTISGLYYNDVNGYFVGLFGRTASYCRITNVGVVDSYFRGGYSVGGVCGFNDASITNSYNTGVVIGNDNVGGLCGTNTGTIANCHNTGVVNGEDNVGGVCGSASGGTITNAYYLNGKADNGVGKISSGSVETTEMLASQFASGEVAWLLNGSAAGESPIWRQTIGEDKYPVLDAKKGIVISSTNEGLNPIIRPTAGTLVGASDVYNFVGIDGKKVYGIEHTGALAANHPYVFTTNKDYVSFVPSDEEATDDTPTCGLTGVLDPAGKKVYGKDNTAGADVCIVFTATALKYANPKGNTVKYGKCYINAEECGITSESVPAMAKSIANFGDGPLIPTFKISNATELYAFAEQVNGGNVKLNAKLTADIVVNANVLDDGGELNGDGGGFKAWTPIGIDTDGKRYEGTFDGQGHTISGLYFSDEAMSAVGLFRTTGTNGAIRNVGIADSYFRAYQHVAGLCASNGGKVENCYNAATCKSATATTGGIVSLNGGVVANCYNRGVVDGENVAAVCFDNNSGTVTNCHYLEGTAPCGIYQGTGVTTEHSADDFAGGRVAWLLNGSEAGASPIWRQTIGEDKYPVLDAKRGIVIYSTRTGLNSVIRPTAGTLAGVADVYNFAGIDGKKVYGIPHTGTLSAEHPYVFTTNKDYVSFVPSDEEATDGRPTCGLTGVLDPAGKKVYGRDNTAGADVCIVFTADALKYANPKGNTVKYGKCYIDADECFHTSVAAEARSIAVFGEGTTTSVDETEATAGGSEGKAYNLQGVEVGKTYKGIVVVNGRKMVRK